MRLSEREKVELLHIARTRIRSLLENTPDPPIHVSNSLAIPCGAFVTLRLDGELRGCVGYVEPRLPLDRTVAEVSAKSAFDDPRFPPLTIEEFRRTEIEISVLTPLRRVENPQSIEVGVHGVVIECGIRRGLLLPQVAEEFGWDRDQLLSHTCLKAGLPPDAWKSPGVGIYCFSAEKFSESEFSAKAI